ncbi:MAG: tRNA (adenosine(37)-N6)-dimethylallyltransferase MiaA [Candidatus Paceibacterota bacterium]|jgi:tRNA dimethylallyltransferase
MKRQTPKTLPKIIVVLGPTATGKSDLAVHLALKFNGEIISADSRQVYRGMDIGSGKITETETKGVPHHLLDVADPRKRVYNADEFRKDGAAAITDILSRGRLPIIAGGTGFYIDALVSGEVFPEVAPDQKLRDRLAKKSATALMKEISRLDPRRARALDPLNKVRIIRAIEIARTLGSVPKVKSRKLYETLYIGLNLPTERLRERIHLRLMKRMEGGKMVREISRLRTSGMTWKRLFALGLEYRYLSLYLRKRLSKEEMLLELEKEIAQYARRQMQWFKRNENVTWLSPGENAKAAQKARKFLSTDKSL